MRRTPEPAPEPEPKPDAGHDAGETSPPYEMQGQAQCGGPEIPESRCTPDESGALECDGLDNDCDGRVDNDMQCDCTLGAARSCFVGPYGRRNMGACRSGIQHCVGEEFTHWGPCEDSQGPSEERCDGMDNDCDGCSDELHRLPARAQLPRPGRPALPNAQPFVPYVLDARRFYAGPEPLSYQLYDPRLALRPHVPAHRSQR